MASPQPFDIDAANALLLGTPCDSCKGTGEIFEIIFEWDMASTDFKYAECRDCIGAGVVPHESGAPDDLAA